MRTQSPWFKKQPFQLHENPIGNAATVAGGLCLVSRAFRSLGFGEILSDTGGLGERAAQAIESICLLCAVGQV